MISSCSASEEAKLRENLECGREKKIECVERRALVWLKYSFAGGTGPGVRVWLLAVDLLTHYLSNIRGFTLLAETKSILKKV